MWLICAYMFIYTRIKSSSCSEKFFPRRKIYFDVRARIDVKGPFFYFI